MRFTGIISAVILSAAFASSATAKIDLTSAEIQVCKTLSQCVDIVERHAPDSFDYRVLNSEFQRFGSKGKAALIDMLASKDETDMRRAQAVLAKGQTLLTPDEQRKVAALWPRGDLDTHAKIMKSALSPLMRARMIETLSHDNPKVRDISRDIIAATVERKMDFPLRPADYGKLTRALLDKPTPALVELMANFEPTKTSPIFTRLLRSEDGATLFAAYQKLFEQNPETAFKALVATLYGLKDDQTKAAFALSHVLRERHKRREDGFYLKFAKDLAEDSEMSLMGRLAGFDAILQSLEAPRLSEPSQYYNIMQLALRSYPNLPEGYLRHMPRQAGETPDLWLNAYWSYFSGKTGDQKLSFIRLIDGFENKTADYILIEALADPGDWRILQAAAQPLGQNGIARAKPALERLKDHPIMAVQIAALTALDGIETGSVKGRAKYWKASLSKASAHCSATPKNFKDEAKTLPFFDLINLDFKASGDKRRFVSTISPIKNGYFVGFDAGRNGGDLRYYDNASGDSLPLKPLMSGALENITAIIPVTPPPLGQYAKAFWVIAQDAGQTDQAKLYRLSGDVGAFKLTYKAELPHRVTAISPQDKGNVFMSFYKAKTPKKDVNPPLLLSPAGTIRRACSSPADTTEALP